MTELSPATQAVLTAYNQGELTTKRTTALVAALRAVADQVHLDKPLGNTDADAGVFAAHHAMCAHILGIAADLEATQ